MDQLRFRVYFTAMGCEFTAMGCEFTAMGCEIGDLRFRVYFTAMGCEFTAMGCEIGDLRCRVYFTAMGCEFTAMGCEYTAMRCEFTVMGCEYTAMRCKIDGYFIPRVVRALKSTNSPPLDTALPSLAVRQQPLVLKSMRNTTPPVRPHVVGMHHICSLQELQHTRWDPVVPLLVAFYNPW
jgi:hypothetical protein